MRPRWLLLLVLWPSIAVAHRIRIEDPVEVSAEVTHGLHAGKLVLAFHNPNHSTIWERVTTASDWLRVELASPYTTKTLYFAGTMQAVEIPAYATYRMTLDLDERTGDLPPGDYEARITIETEDGVRYLNAHAYAPYHCGLSFDHVKTPPPQSKLPYVLGALAIIAFLVGLALYRRGAARARVPHSIL